MAPKQKQKDRLRQILKVIQNYHDQYGYAPSYRDICQETDISSTSMVNYYLKKLEDENYIERDENISRTLNITQKARKEFKAFLGTVNELVTSHPIPLVGQIVASEPVPVPSGDLLYTDYETSVDVAESLIPNKSEKEQLFALTVSGDSMIDAMVNDGDIVIMKPAQEANNGEMVAVRINQDETTLKYFYKENDRVRLQPANPTMDPIYIEKTTPIEIQGKVVLVLRQT